MKTMAALAAGLAIVLVGPVAATTQKGRAPRPEGVKGPILAAVVPPGATIRVESEWHVMGRNLSAVERWLVSGEGVEVAEAVVNKAGTEATLRVLVSAEAEPGYRELRGLGPEGISNLLLVRIDSLDQAPEEEPNNEPSRAQEVPIGSAVAATLTPQDVDHFRVEGRRGGRITIEVEARRLGVPILPVVTVRSPSGEVLLQARESRGVDQDARASFVFPADGSYLIQVRDALYAGADRASYRLRLDEAPFATALSPLGGPPGATVLVTASGGSLPEPITAALTLPDAPGQIIEPPPFDTPWGLVLPPGRLIVGSGRETVRGPGATVLELGETAEGLIAVPGQVDRYLVPVRKNQPIRVQVRAERLGSWLDAVVTLRDSVGNVLAENDDPVAPNNARRGAAIAAPGGESPTDSRLDFAPQSDGEVTVEVTDRFGVGGPEYGYRLEVGPARPDLAIGFLTGDPNQRAAQAQGGRRGASARVVGVVNVKPGSTIPVNFQVAADGETGPIEVRAEGLPPGVTAAPVTVKPSSGPSRSRGNRPRPPRFASGNLVLKVAADAPASVGSLRLIATATPKEGEPILREATATVPLDTIALNRAAPPVTRDLTALPLVVLGRPADARPSPGEEPRPVVLAGVEVPGVLLQGDRIDLAVLLDPPGPPPGAFKLSGESRGEGLSAQVVPPSADRKPAEGDDRPVVRVSAAADARPGVRTVAVVLEPAGGEATTREVAVIVRSPIALRAHPGPILPGPGGRAEVFVGVVREPGCEGPVELRAEGLPEGVEAAPTTVEAGEDGAVLLLAMGEGQGALAGPVAMRIVGEVRMPGGPVVVESPIRPMLGGGPAEKETR